MKKLTGIVLGLAFVLCAFSAQMVYAQAQECDNSGACDDGIFCNGVEVCVQSAPGAQSVCEDSTPPCGDDTPVCDEDNDRCVECLNDDNCTGDAICVDNVCVECEDNATCDDGDPCTGKETCVSGQCQSGVNPCPPGDICIPFNGVESEPAAPASQDYICTGCVSDDNCTDDLYCNGDEYCSEGTCFSSGDPCDPSNWNSVPTDLLPPPVCDEETDSCVECITDDNCTNEAEPYCVENVCVSCRDDEDCDNDLFCDGAETCDNGTCFDGEPPCRDSQPMPSALSFCNEETDQCVECFEDFDCSDNGTPRCDGVMCVECLDDFDCDNGTFCREGVCAEQACDLIIKPRQVRINKKFRPVVRWFRITGGEGFNPSAELDFGLIKVRRAIVNRKGVLKVLATIPAAAIPNKGPYEIRVGDCVGEIILK